MPTPSDIGLNIKIRTIADTSGAEQATQSMTAFGDSTRDVTGGLRELTRGSFEAGQVLRGLERGGIGGTMTAMRGLRGLVRTMGPEFLEMGAIGAAFAVPIMAAIHLMNEQTKANIEEMNGGWESAKVRAEQYKKMIEEVKKTTEEWSKATKADIDEINEELKDSEKWHAAIEAREKKETEAVMELQKAQLELDKQRALAEAKTPEDKARITAGFEGKERDLKARQEGISLENEQQRAQQKITENDKVERELSDERRNKQVEINEALDKYQDALAKSAELAQRERDAIALRSQRADLANQQQDMLKNNLLLATGAGGGDQAAYDKLGGQLSGVDDKLKGYGRAGTMSEDTANAQREAATLKTGYEDMVKEFAKRNAEIDESFKVTGKNILDAQSVLKAIPMQQQAEALKQTAANVAEANKDSTEMADAQRTLSENAKKEAALKAKISKTQAGEVTTGDQVAAAGEAAPLFGAGDQHRLTSAFTFSKDPSLQDAPAKGGRSGGMTEEQREAAVKAETEELKKLTDADIPLKASIDALKVQQADATAAAHKQMDTLHLNTAALDRVAEALGRLNSGGTMTRGDGRTVVVPPTVTNSDTAMTRSTGDSYQPARATPAAQEDQQTTAVASIIPTGG
jgi:hypothetical protein